MVQLRGASVGLFRLSEFLSNNVSAVSAQLMQRTPQGHMLGQDHALTHSMKIFDVPDLSDMHSEYLLPGNLSSCSMRKMEKAPVL